MMKTCCCRVLCGGQKQQTNFPVSLTFHLSGFFFLFFLAQSSFVTSSCYSQFGFSATQRYSSVSSYLQHTVLAVTIDWRCLSFLVLKCTEKKTWHPNASTSSQQGKISEGILQTCWYRRVLVTCVKCFSLLLSDTELISEPQLLKCCVHFKCSECSIPVSQCYNCDLIWSPHMS